MCDILFISVNVARYRAVCDRQSAGTGIKAALGHVSTKKKPGRGAPC
jgi:hypothetical protein